jgi:hypothetical protein
MSHSTLHTLADVQAAVPWDQPYDRSLEEYLRALWVLVQSHRSEQVSWTLIGSILTDAFTIEPLAFDPQWLQYNEPPLRKNISDPYAYLQHMLLYQIADLHRMQEAGTLNLSPVTLYGGIDSPTGHRWYNFSTESYFECAFSGAEEGNQSQECDWDSLADLLYLGQIYE